MERSIPPKTTNSVWAFQDGGFIPAEGVPITDRGFRYGLHSFETLRVRNGRAEFVDEHLALLRQSPWASALAWADVGEWLRRPFPADGMLRLFLTAGDGPASAAAGSSRLYAWFEPRDFSAPPAAIAAALAPDPVWPQPGSGKTGNYYLNLAALDAAKARGFGEALLFDRDDYLAGACLANVFYVRGGKLFTPPGFRAGVVRGWVMRQLPVEVRPLHRAEIGEVESAFLTSSGIGILPVRCIEDRLLSKGGASFQLASVFP